MSYYYGRVCYEKGGINKLNAAKDIKNFTLQELKAEMAGMKESAFRANQIFSWLYKKGACSFSKMRNLPKSLIGKLNKHFYISSLELGQHLKSKDGTEKFVFELKDGNYIETVLIPSAGRKTICLSTQVGCKFGCSFCASGLMGFKRDLSASEIVNQILYLTQKVKHKITNYVFMGMGEPLDNYENTVKAIAIMNEPAGLNIGAGRITVSTAGIATAIKKLKDLKYDVNLSISLHAGNDELRSRLMPINKKYPLDSVLKACRKYLKRVGRKITLEYILIKDINDGEGNAVELAGIAKRLKAKVNLIKYSPVESLNFEAPSEKNTQLFINNLKKLGINTTFRKSKGKDIMAACGQLAGRAVNG